MHQRMDNVQNHLAGTKAKAQILFKKKKINKLHRHARTVQYDGSLQLFFTTFQLEETLTMKG